MLDVDKLAGYSFFGVFDGHGGSLVAKHACVEAATRPLRVVLWSHTFSCACATPSSAATILSEIQAAPEFAGCKTAEDLPPAIRTGFLNFDRKTKDLPQIKAGADHSGSTAITAFVTPTHYVVANCGGLLPPPPPTGPSPELRRELLLCTPDLVVSMGVPNQATPGACCPVGTGAACGRPSITSRRWYVVARGVVRALWLRQRCVLRDVGSRCALYRACRRAGGRAPAH